MDLRVRVSLDIINNYTLALTINNIALLWCQLGLFLCTICKVINLLSMIHYFNICLTLIPNGINFLSVKCFPSSRLAHNPLCTTAAQIWGRAEGGTRKFGGAMLKLLDFMRLWGLSMDGKTWEKILWHYWSHVGSCPEWLGAYGSCHAQSLSDQRQWHNCWACNAGEPAN